LPGTFQHDVSYESFNAWGKFMAADEYRRHAIECLRLADETLTARSRILLVHMAEAWLRLVHQAEKNVATDLLCETPPAREHPERQEHREEVQPKMNGNGT
jgi:hypothetical protein